MVRKSIRLGANGTLPTLPDTRGLHSIMLLLYIYTHSSQWKYKITKVRSENGKNPFYIQKLSGCGFYCPSRLNE